jgi:hypothetical protein
MLLHHRAAMVDDATIQQTLEFGVEFCFLRRGILHNEIFFEEFMGGITSCDDDTVQVDCVAGMQRPDFRI